MSGKRNFSSSMSSTNQAFMPRSTQSGKAVKVAFVLPDHFSMMTYTTAIDALVTTNLVKSSAVFSHQTFSLNDNSKVLSDIHIEISTSHVLDELVLNGEQAIDILIVCGGFRCDLSENKQLSKKLKAAFQQNIIIGGLWNGAIPLAYAKLLDHKTCAIHQDNYAFVQEMFPTTLVSDKSLEMEHSIATCSGPVSALSLMLNIVELHHDKHTVDSVKKILRGRRSPGSEAVTLESAKSEIVLPDKLQELIDLMNSNIEEPFTIEELSKYINMSRRQVERLFQTHLSVSPSKYYLELRITYARRLLLQTNESITNISVACGFTTSSHFSNSFKSFFGKSPSAIRQTFSN